MHRLLFGTCLLALAVIAVRAEDVKKDAKTEEKKEEKSVGDTFKGLFKELVGKYNAADKNKATQKDKDALITTYAEKFIDLAKKNPKDEATLGILVSTVSLPIPMTKDGPKGQALAILKKDHVKSTKLAPALRGLGRSSDPESASFVKAVLDENTDKAMRAAAFKAYLDIQERIIMDGKNPKAVTAAKKEIETSRKLIKTEFKDVNDLFVGDAMPELTSKNLEDKDVKLSDLKGKVVVVDVWATWCPPCRAMIPHERELVKKLKDKPFVLVSVSADEKKETLTDFLKETPMPWTHWWNGQKGGVITALGVTYYPTIYVVDGKGVIRFKDVRGEEMDKAVEKLLTEMEAKK